MYTFRIACISVVKPYDAHNAMPLGKYTYCKIQEFSMWKIIYRIIAIFFVVSDVLREDDEMSTINRKDVANVCDNYIS